MFSDYFKLALKNLTRRKLRSWLTMTGIIISIAIIFILISLSVGLQNAVKEQFRLLGTDKFYVYPKLTSGLPGAINPIKLTTDDVNAISRIGGVKYVAYFVMDSGRLEFSDKVRYFSILGLPLDTPAVSRVLYESTSIKMQEGRALQKGDSGMVMLGSDFKAGLFDKPVNPGDKIQINNRTFKVVGIVAPIGNPDDDKHVYIPLTDFKSLFNSGKRVDIMLVQIQQGSDIDEVAQRTEKKLRSFRGLTEKTQDFSVITPEEFIRTFQSILGIITIFLAGVATISLVVGAIGITNTMYASILERTREIGVMKAVGARNSDVLKLFVIESGFLGLVGGIIGVLLGMGVGKAIEFIAVKQFNTNLLQVAFPLYLIIGCLAFAFITGVIAGAWPAWRASRIRPVQALRYE